MRRLCTAEIHAHPSGQPLALHLAETRACHVRYSCLARALLCFTMPGWRWWSRISQQKRAQLSAPLPYPIFYSSLITSRHLSPFPIGVSLLLSRRIVRTRLTSTLTSAHSPQELLMQLLILIPLSRTCSSSSRRSTPPSQLSELSTRHEAVARPGAPLSALKVTELEMLLSLQCVLVSRFPGQGPTPQVAPLNPCSTKLHLFYVLRLEGM